MKIYSGPKRGRRPGLLFREGEPVPGVSVSCRYSGGTAGHDVTSSPCC